MSRKFSLASLVAVLMVVMFAQGCAKNTKTIDGVDGGSSFPLANRGMEVRDEAALQDVTFAFNQSAIKADAKMILKQNAEWMMQNQESSVLVEGHCDERGTTEYNLALGERRALTVKSYLVTLGIKASRLYTISYGEELPLDTDHTEEAWSQNRRAHMAVTVK